jgi:Icc-related predicted phosphoesterase
LRVQLISDVHVEFDRGKKPFQLPEVERDVLVVAGDLGEGEAGTDFLFRELERSPVIYVLGNHEFYHHYWQTVREHWRHKHQKMRVRGNALHVLDNRAVTLNGVRFIGATLWADFDQDNPVTKLAAMRRMADYGVIGFQDGEEDRLLLPDDVLEDHRNSRAFISKELRANHKRSVVVTHHAPSARSIPVGYRDSSVNGCYVSSLDDMIEQYQPDAWCHGHTHVRHDYLIGKTRILCNPRGYNGYELTHGFNPDFTFDV